MGSAGRTIALFVTFRTLVRGQLYVPYAFHFVTETRGFAAVEFGLMISVYNLTLVVAEIPTGALADRFGRRRALMLGAVLLAVSFLIYTVATKLAVFLIGQVLVAIGTALVSGADSALVHDALEREGRASEYPRAESLANACALGLTVIGYPLADLLLVRDDDPVLTYVATSLLCLLAAACTAGFGEPHGARRPAERATTIAFRELSGGRLLRIIAVSTGVFVLVRAAAVIFYVPVLQQAGVPVRLYGTTLAGLNLVGAAAAWTGHRALSRFGAHRCAVGLQLGLGALYALLATASGPGILAGLVILGAQNGLYPALLRPILQRAIRDSRGRATLLSVDAAAGRIGFAVVSAYAGWALGLLSLAGALATTLALGGVPLLAAALSRARADRGDRRV